MRTTGRDLQPLTDTQLNASAPDFHPSGRWIAFDTHDSIAPSPNVGHIVVANADSVRPADHRPRRRRQLLREPVVLAGWA